MINLVFKDGKELKKKEGKYIIGLLDGEIYEADNFRELTAVVCGLEYQDCECAETELHMRVKAAKRIGLATMTAEEMTNSSQNDEDGDESGIRESIIIYDERIGKIPYSYTDANVDYAIHGNPELIRVECDKTFIYSLEKNRLIAVFMRMDDGEYKRIPSVLDIDTEIEKELEPFKRITERVPLHKKLGE
ncbi:MAG: hypothetical protein PHE79_11725 [Eubacteriales bacterium]|nr:hypothetical protein [Eubacteriales bacterium]